jgi:sugar phosphate isomerase/epimerase
MRFAAHCLTWGRQGDRFVLSGYNEGLPIDQIIRAAARIDGVEGIELSRGALPEDLNPVRSALRETGLAVSSIAASISGHPRWKRGAFTSDDADIRHQALATVKRTMDLAAELGSYKINLWFGQEGYDYCFEVDYGVRRQRLVEGLRECAAHRPDVVIAIEYKPKEPKRHLLVDTAATTALLCQDVGAGNVGALLDVGHALIAYENLGATVQFLQQRRRLAHLHLNDNYRLWDDDMITGSVHMIELLEMLYWLRRTGYDGWYVSDAVSPIEDPVRIVEENIGFVRGLERALDRIGMPALTAAVESGHATEALRLVRSAILP